MKKSLLKLSALLLALVMMLSIATGCGGGAATSDPVSGDDDDEFVVGNVDFDAGGSDSSTVSGSGASNPSGGDTSTGSGVTKDEDVFKNIPKELKGKTVVFSDFGEAITDEYQKVLKKFTQDTGIRVRMMQFLNAEYIQKVVQQIAAGKAPDVGVSNYWFPTALEMVQPLPEYFNLDDGFWDKRVATELSVGGKYYFVNSMNTPISSGYMVYYNKTIFNAAGLKTPQEYLDENNWTYETLKEAAKSCVQAGYKGAIVEPLYLAEQLGTSVITYDNKTGTFTANAKDSNLIKAFQYMSSGIEEGVFYNALGSAFSQGGIGMTMLGTYGLKNDGYFRNMLPSEIGVAPLPTSYEGKKLEYFPAGMRGYGICRGAENPEAAYYMLRYFLDLDKYEPAGANMFANKSLEKYYKQVHLPAFQKSKIFWEHHAEPLMISGQRWDSPEGYWKAVKTAASGQIAVELSKRANILENAAKLATQKVKDFTSK